MQHFQCLRADFKPVMSEYAQEQGACDPYFISSNEYRMVKIHGSQIEKVFEGLEVTHVRMSTMDFTET